MKKVLITMAVLTSMVAGAMVFSSFAAPKQNAQKECMQTEVNVPTYWEGYAYPTNGQGGAVNLYGIYISVYQTENACNSFYAKTKDGKEAWVKTNPNYDPDNRVSWMRRQKYYVTFGSDNYYFSM